MNIDPFTTDELFSTFHQEESSSKHLLVIYSLAIGLKAKNILDIGMGLTTRTLRSAVQITGGTVHTIDWNKKRFADLTQQQTPQWRLYLEECDQVIQKIQEPFDFVMHDGAHDYFQVKKDLLDILPRVKKYGIICVHDTQHYSFGRDMILAIQDAVQEYSVSLTVLPYGAGLTIIRMEESIHETVKLQGKMIEGSLDSHPFSVPMVPGEDPLESKDIQQKSRKWFSWFRRKIKYKMGHS